MARGSCWKGNGWDEASRSRQSSAPRQERSLRSFCRRARQGLLSISRLGWLWLSISIVWGAGETEICWACPDLLTQSFRGGVQVSVVHRLPCGPPQRELPQAPPPTQVALTSGLAAIDLGQASFIHCFLWRQVGEWLSSGGSGVPLELKCRDWGCCRAHGSVVSSLQE